MVVVSGGLRQEKEVVLRLSFSCVLESFRACHHTTTAFSISQPIQGFVDVAKALVAHQEKAEELARIEALKQAEEAKMEAKKAGGAPSRGGGGGGKKKGGGGGGFDDGMDDDDSDDGEDDDEVEEEGIAFQRWLNGKDDSNLTPLHLASRFGHNQVRHEEDRSSECTCFLVLLCRTT